MHDSQHKPRANLILAGVIVLAAAAVIAVVVFISRLPRMSPHLEEVFTKTLRKSQLVSSMRINLHASVEAEKSAVLAETDEASQQFADQAGQAATDVEQARREIEQLIETEKIPREMDLLREFNTCWDRFQEIDRTLLPLAVQNTNLKATRLSFGPAGEAVSRFEKALNSLTSNNPTSQAADRVGATMMDRPEWIAAHLDDYKPGLYNV